MLTSVSKTRNFQSVLGAFAKKVRALVTKSTTTTQITQRLPAKIIVRSHYLHRFFGKAAWQFKTKPRWQHGTTTSKEAKP